jgi:outer membrane beta-barrel protein
LIPLPAVCLSLLLTASAALAQSEFEGLDLTDPKENEQTEENKQKADEGKFEDIKSETPITPSGQAEPESTRKPVKLTEGDTQQLERDITQEDRVKSVQRKLYIKKYRFELSPYVFSTVNDPYYSKLGVAVRGGFHFADTVALSGRFSLMQVIPSDDRRTATQTFRSQIFFSVPNWSAMGNLEWSPLYGKIAIFNSILHFDAFIAGGIGVVRAATSSLPDRGLYFASDVGVGLRFVVKDYLAVIGSLINTSYVDQPAGITKGVTQNILALGIGLSLFIPFKSTGRESE